MSEYKSGVVMNFQLFVVFTNTLFYALIKIFYILADTKIKRRSINREFKTPKI